MKYEVLKDFTDEGFPVFSEDGKKKVPLSLKTGATFIPAAVHYPTDRVNAKLLDGSLKLTTKIAPKVGILPPLAEEAVPESETPTPKTNPFQPAGEESAPI